MRDRCVCSWSVTDMFALCFWALFPDYLVPVLLKWFCTLVSQHSLPCGSEVWLGRHLQAEWERFSQHATAATCNQMHTHQSHLPVIQGTNQLVRSDWVLDALLRDASTHPGRQASDCSYVLSQRHPKYGLRFHEHYEVRHYRHGWWRKLLPGQIKKKGQQLLHFRAIICEMFEHQTVYSKKSSAAVTYPLRGLYLFKKDFEWNRNV